MDGNAGINLFNSKTCSRQFRSEHAIYIVQKIHLIYNEGCVVLYYGLHSTVAVVTSTEMSIIMSKL